ncbi:MAG: sigma-70 family RNA polymerase sigma factor [Planctomycetota bacterium]
MMDSRQWFEILVREHAEMLIVFLRSIVRDAVLVDDLFQETLLVAWRSIDRFDRTRSFGRWLRGIARKLVLAQRRRDAGSLVLYREDVLDLIELRCTALHRCPGDTLEEKLAGLRECLRTLPEPERHALRLRYFDDVRGARLAERLQTTVESAKKLLQRGRRRLWACLERKLVFGED